MRKFFCLTLIVFSASIASGQSEESDSANASLAEDSAPEVTVPDFPRAPKTAPQDSTAGQYCQECFVNNAGLFDNTAADSKHVNRNGNKTTEGTKQ